MIIIFSGPSGVGKSTIINNLSNDFNFYFSTSHTTRPQRESEIEGKDYYFISEDEFNSMISNDEFLEYERYGSYYYGTSKKELDRDDIIILDLEVNGATKLLTSNDSYIGIFIDIDPNYERYHFCFEIPLKYTSILHRLKRLQFRYFLKVMNVGFLTLKQQYYQ